MNALGHHVTTKEVDDMIREADSDSTINFVKLFLKKLKSTPEMDQ